MSPLRIFYISCSLMLFGFLMFLAGFMSAYVVKEPAAPEAQKNIAGRIGQLTAETAQNTLSETGARLIANAIRVK